MKRSDSPCPQVADYVFKIFTRENDPAWISFLMKQTGNSLLSQAAVIALSDISGGGLHINGINQPFFFLKIGSNAYLFDECIVLEAPDLPESIIQAFPGKDAGETFDCEILKGILIDATERLNNNNLRCVLDATFLSLPDISGIKATYFWAKLFLKAAFSVRINGSPGQNRLNDRLIALQKFMQ